MGAHMKYGKVTLHVLKITSHPEDNTVRARWRVETVPGNSIFFKFLRMDIRKMSDTINSYRDTWIDGFSIFHCDSNGKVYKHVADKVIPDSNIAENKDRVGLAMKLALALGLASSDSSNISGVFANSLELIKNVIANYF